MRERLGLDPRKPIDLSDFKKRKNLRIQEDRALNRVLQTEVHNIFLYETCNLVKCAQIHRLPEYVLYFLRGGSCCFRLRN